mgnify:CR=1 FL=1
MIRSLSARHRHLLAAGLLLALPFIMFWRIWWPAPALRQVITYGDFVEQHYLMRAFVARELSHGRLPLWDPYTFGGQPAVAATLFQVFYPLGLWQVLLPDPLPFLALELEVLFHLGLAGLFTYLFVYRLTRSSGAGLTYANIVHGFQWADLLGILRGWPGEWSPLYVGSFPCCWRSLDWIVHELPPGAGPGGGHRPDRRR